MRPTRLLLLLALLLPLRAPSQAIRGRVVDRLRGGPVAGALVELQDSSGRVLRRDLTSPTGAFRILAPASGMFRLRTAAIGFAIRQPDAVLLAGTELVLPDLGLDPAAAILPDIVVAGKRRACGRDILGDPVLGRLLEGARTSLTLIEATLDLSPRFTVEEVRTTSTLAGRSSVVRADTTRGTMTSWPIGAADAEVLRRDGFARLLAPGEGVGRIYYGPDLRVLFTDWFLESHCYSIEGNRKDEAAGVIRVRYDPRQKSTLVDLSGEMLLDAATVALREFTFTHRNLPSHIPGGMAGGMIAFARLESGAWLPVRWRIFAPIESAPSANAASRTVVLGGARPDARGSLLTRVTGSVTLTGRVVDTPDGR